MAKLNVWIAVVVFALVMIHVGNGAALSLEKRSADNNLDTLADLEKLDNDLRGIPLDKRSAHTLREKRGLRDFLDRVSEYAKKIEQAATHLKDVAEHESVRRIIDLFRKKQN